MHASRRANMSKGADGGIFAKPVGDCSHSPDKTIANSAGDGKGEDLHSIENSQRNISLAGIFKRLLSPTIKNSACKLRLTASNERLPEHEAQHLEGRSLILQLPDELLLRIGRYSQPRDAWSLHLTCQRLHQIALSLVATYDMYKIRAYEKAIGRLRYEETLKKEQAGIKSKRLCCGFCKDAHEPRFFEGRQNVFVPAKWRVCKDAKYRLFLWPNVASTYAGLLLFEQGTREVGKEYLEETELKRGLKALKDFGLVETHEDVGHDYHRFVSAGDALQIYSCKEHIRPEKRATIVEEMQKRTDRLCPHLRVNDAHVTSVFTDTVLGDLLQGGDGHESERFYCSHLHCSLKYHFVYLRIHRPGSGTLAMIGLRRKRSFFLDGSPTEDVSRITSAKWLANIEKARRHFYWTGRGWAWEWRRADP